MSTFYYVVLVTMEPHLFPPINLTNIWVSIQVIPHQFHGYIIFFSYIHSFRIMALTDFMLLEYLSKTTTYYFDSVKVINKVIYFTLGRFAVLASKVDLPQDDI